jgi:DedD protein
MEAHLQQRIVGAIVLVTLGVIFIPALLDGSGYKTRQVQDIKVGEKPGFPPLSQKKLDPIATPLDSSNNTRVEDNTGSKAASESGSDSGKAEKKPLKSFALQAGTFSSNENAEKLRDRLKESGYTTFVHKDRSGGKTSYKVRIGPELEYDVLDKIREDIRKSHKIDAYIVNHP